MPEPLSETDLDLLADYTEGLLDEADSVRVAALVASDERWASAHRLLAEAAVRVDAALAAYADATPSLPADVAARIDAALRGERVAGDGTIVSLEAARKRRDGRQGGSIRDREARRAARSWVRLSAAAAGVVVLVFGFGVLGLHLSDGSRSASTSSARAPDAGPATPELTNVSITASGLDYRANDLGSPPRTPAAISTFGGVRPGSTEATQGTQPMLAGPRLGPVAPELGRLAGRAALSNCLAAVTAIHGGVVTAVDFARYAGQPAAIITLKTPDLRVAVGATCGLPNAGADELASASTR